jgi:calcium/calmodulin-dependent protein kinase I
VPNSHRLEQNIKKPSSTLSEELRHLLPSSNYEINPADYRISHYLAAGGAGVVYSAKHHYNDTKIAMKFFGYGTKQVTMEEIYHEIKLLSAVNGLRGLVQLKGIFMDSPNGYVNNKLVRQCYPVICMELLEGGDLFDRIQARKMVSEKFVGRIFIEILLALDALHTSGYIHCDLKLENVMFTTAEDDDEEKGEGDTGTQVKLIDFGLMVPLPPSRIFLCETIHGTAGYVAPESIKYCQYSPKSDLWQAGCILYSLLSGFQAFHPQYPELIVQGRYMKMSGIGWENISQEAKDLLQLIFTIQPEDRPTIAQVLDHPWLQGAAPDVDMGEQYYQRIRQRALRQRMKNVVFNRDLLAANQEIKEKLKRILPLLKPRQKQRRTRSSVIRGNAAASLSGPSNLDPSSSHLDPPSQQQQRHNQPQALSSQLPLPLNPSSSLSPVPSPSHSQSSSSLKPSFNYRRVVSLDDIDLLFQQQRAQRQQQQSQVENIDPETHRKVIDDFNVKLTTLRTALVQQTVGAKHLRSSDQRRNSDRSDESGGGGTGAGGPPPDIDLETFITVLHDCGLPELATPQMFHIFGKTSCHSPCFTLTSVSLSPLSHRPQEHREDRHQRVSRHYGRLS